MKLVPHEVWKTVIRAHQTDHLHPAVTGDACFAAAKDGRLLRKGRVVGIYKWM